MLRSIAAIVLATAAGDGWTAHGAAEGAAVTSGAEARVSYPGESFGASVTDQTVSVGGHEFYTAFSAFWHDKPFSDRYAVAICEHASARRGNKVVVEFAGRTVFQAMLPKGTSSIKPMSETAVEASYERVVNAEVQRLLMREQDLGPDEI
jgi:curli production assembly/transport component CsgE